MTQATDILLNGAGYMVQPGSYKRTQDGAPEGRTGRVVMRDFFGGQRRALQLERDRGGPGLAAGPAFDGQGVKPWPKAAQDTLIAGTSLPWRDVRLPAVAIGNYVYFATGTKVYRTVSLTTGTWAAPTLFYDFGAGKTVTGLFNARGEIGCSLSMGGVTTVLTTAGTVSGPIMGNPNTRFGVGWAGHVVLAQATAGGATDTVYLTGIGGLETRLLDSPIVNIGLWAGKVAVATRQSMYSFSGTTDEGSGGTGKWSGEFAPFHNDSWADETDDYVFIAGYGGKLLTWIHKQVVEFNPSGDRAGWRATGLEGVRCYGGCVAGGYLVVAIETAAGRSQLWAWDGAGWWRIRDVDAGFQRNVWPTNLAGAGNYDLMVFRDGQLNVDLFRLVRRDNAAHTTPIYAEYATAMLDAGERDKPKAWRKVGAVFAALDIEGDAGDLSTCTVTLQHRKDGAAGWTQVAASAKAGNTLPNMNQALEADIGSDGLVSRFLQLKATWTPEGSWAPVLAALWAEYEILDSPARRRKWSFVVAARDQTLDRAGALLSRTGRQLIAELWAAWQAGTTLPFRDQDYDADATERRVRIVGIEEQVATPSDAGRWGQALVKLTLVEV